MSNGENYPPSAYAIWVTSHRKTSIVALNCIAWFIALAVIRLVPDSESHVAATVLSGVLGTTMMPNKWNRSNLLIAVSGAVSTALLVAVYGQITGVRIGMVSGNPGTMIGFVAASTTAYLMLFALIYSVVLGENFISKKRS
ncbi:hypothetical protein [Mesorhizobium sp. ZC-5]|uniref:hypothetical protein n=1 Tax=Mesorhizobium sp. ZC-5 TaxID=2986066 RepID=UPI0021E953B6|nr:hypothetical protein [Mesorhizobium sp. ZC-5]MCV3241833.1 hypothetical protein [Mesorhizobium sp. ZC-5]